MSAIQLSKAERMQIVSVLSELKTEGLIYGRRHRRQPVRQFMWLKRLPRPGNPRGASFKIISEDASLQGLGFVTRRKLYINEFVVIPLQFKEGGGMLVLCRVCFCAKLPDGGYRVGVEFKETLPDPKCKERIPNTWLKEGWAAEVQSA